MKLFIDLHIPQNYKMRASLLPELQLAIGSYRNQADIA
jgi:hypothetical protein